MTYSLVFCAPQQSLSVHALSVRDIIFSHAFADTSAKAKEAWLMLKHNQSSVRLQVEMRGDVTLHLLGFMA